MAGTLILDTITSNTSGPVVFRNTSGTEIGKLCKAWINFNGITTATIRSSFNVSSVTRNSTGKYTVAFTTAMADTNYAVVAGAWNNGGGQGGWISYGLGVAGSYPAGVATTSVDICTFTQTGTAQDQDSVSVAIFR